MIRKGSVTSAGGGGITEIMNFGIFICLYAIVYGWLLFPIIGFLLVGVSTQQKDHLKFLYEESEDFSVMPSFAVIPMFKMRGIAGAPGLQVDPTQVLHGEQYLELMQPLSRCGTLTSTSTVSDVLDKGSGAVIVQDGETLAFPLPSCKNLHINGQLVNLLLPKKSTGF